MKSKIIWVAIVGSSLLATPAPATVRYVDVNSASPVSPYTNWATAATDIQSAVDVAAAGDLVLVTNGVYQTGGRPAKDGVTNRVNIDKALKVQSINGPAVTIIRGYQVPGITNGTSSVRCVNLASGATLSGFTLSNGSTPGGGGGVNCLFYTSTVTNCIITGNAAISYGGGGMLGTYVNCTLSGNTVSNIGGGIYLGTAVNCLIIGNSAQYGGGTHRSELNNCTVAGNTASVAGGGAHGSSGSTMNNCIVYDNTAPSGSNHTAMTMNYCCTVPIFGSSSFTNAPRFIDPPAGNFNLQTNSPCINAGANSYVSNSTDLDGNPRIRGGTVDLGAYEYPLPNIHYVNLGNVAPVSPYLSWPTAATNIQDAIDAANAGDVIVVGDGVYRTGGRVSPSSSFGFGGGGSNRVVIDKTVTVRSVNGPSQTRIQGYQVPGTGTGTNAIRCAWLTNGAVLSGFTLTNGATANLNVKMDGSGGGAFSDGVITNCVLIGNLSRQGGGVFGGTLDHCTLIGNSTPGGSAGGAWAAMLNNCLVVGNSATDGAGGGTGAYCALNNCTVAYNSARYGGGSYGGCLTNCIVYFNAGGNYQFTTLGSCYLNHCCTITSYTNGVGNITNEPAFVDPSAGNFHLQSNSPCINAGNNAAITGGTDLDGSPRIAGGTVDMGAYEFQNPASILSYAWLQQYGLPNDGSADYVDADGDGMNNCQEWQSGTIPTNASSLLKMTAVANDVSGKMVTWQSVSGKTYFLQRSSDLVVQPAFSTVSGNIIGQAGTTSYLDSTAVGPGPFFYRVGVQP
jgi:parallel beta-helix repeat protein